MATKVTILGAGESGVGAALLARSLGYDVFVSDASPLKPRFISELETAGIEFESGTHTFEIIESAEIIVKSPGIPENVEVMKRVRNAGKEVISEIEFAIRHSGGKTIAITGTNGKTTTTNLVYHLLDNAGFDVGMAGNVGKSFARQVFESDREWFVLELSSFQLDDTFSLHPTVAILLNITPDHLDRYDNDFTSYVDSKFRITRNMGVEDTFIYWAEDLQISQRLQEDAAFKKIDVWLNNPAGSASLLHDRLKVGNLEMGLDHLPLQGKHNYINIMCATAAAKAAGVSDKVILDSLESFRNIPHRMEDVAVIDGIRFVNDSKATNVESVYYALDAYNSNITWIAGGIDKGNDYSRIKPLVKEKVKWLICLGVDNSKIIRAFEDSFDKILETEDINDATRKGYDISSQDDVVLFSPACASFDLFKNYEDRGDQFKQAVRQLEIEKGKDI